VSLTVDPQTVEHETATAEFAEVAGWLQDHLGQQLAAYVVGLRNPKVVGKWRRGGQPRATAEFRARTAYVAARRRLRRDDRARVAARLQQPARRRGARLAAASCRGPGDVRFLVSAARAFAGGAA
jgi:hypothetical protein